MSTNFTSRLGVRPFVKKRAASPVKKSSAADVAEFQALMLIMQEANLDLLGKFYGGARLTYDKSVTQKLLAAAVRKASTGISAKPPSNPSPGTAWVIERAKALSRLVMKHEDAYLIDNVGAQLYERAAEAISDAIKEQLPSTAVSGTPVIGLLKSGWDALSKDADAIDKLARTVIAHRHGVELAAGEPRAAAEAVKKLLARKAGMMAVSGASSTAAFAVGVAAEVGSMGAAVGTAELGTAVMQMVVDIILMFTQIIIDIVDYERGSKLLANLDEMVNPTPDTIVRMFKGCPVLGCYMLATPIFPTSAFVYLMSKTGSIASVDEVERIAITHVNPLRLEASWLIRQASFRMENPESRESNDKIRAVMRGESESEIQKALELRNLKREAIGDATTRSEYLDRSLVQKGLEYATRSGPGKYSSQFASDRTHGFGSDGKAHIYNRHEGKLHGLSEKLVKFKKSASTFVTNTRIGGFLKEAEVIEETEAEVAAKKLAMRAPPPLVRPNKPLPKPPGRP